MMKARIAGTALALAALTGAAAAQDGEKLDCVALSVPGDTKDRIGEAMAGSGDEPLVRMVAGDVPDSSVRVVVAIGDASVDADLAEVGPEPGRLWFATAFFVDSALGAFDVVAYDAAGNPVATGSQE